MDSSAFIWCKVLSTNQIYPESTKFRVVTTPIERPCADQSGRFKRIPKAFALTSPPNAAQWKQIDCSTDLDTLSEVKDKQSLADSKLISKGPHAVCFIKHASDQRKRRKIYYLWWKSIKRAISVNFLIFTCFVSSPNARSFFDVFVYTIA